MNIPQNYKGKPLRHAWEYRTVAGEVLGVVGRYELDGQKKDVVPFFTRVNGSGWRCGAASEPRPLFGLDAIAQRQPGDVVLVVEGEKCAAALHSMGIVAVTSPGGAKAAAKADWRPLSGCGSVYLLPDNDAPGAEYVRDVCSALSALEQPPTLYVMQLDGLPDGGDLVDWVQARCNAWDGYSPLLETDCPRVVAELRDVLAAGAEPISPNWLTVDGAGWPAPIPLDAVRLPDWPRDVFPEPVQSFVNSLTEASETPPELAALMVLSVLATASHGKYRLRMGPDRCEPVNIWTVCALPPGSRKTFVQKAAAEPLSEWEQQQRKELEAQIQRAESERATMQARIDRLRKKAAGADDPDAFEYLQAEIADMEQALPNVSVVPQLWTADVTPENLATIMAANGERMGVLSDEAGIFGIIAGRYSQGMPNLDMFLQGHSGSSTRVNRGSRPPVFLDRPALTMGLAVQPEVLRGLTACGEFRGRGLLARFLYAVPPSNLGSRRLEGKPLSEDWRQRYQGVVSAILNYPHGGPDEHGRSVPYILKLSSGAFESWKVLQREVEPKMGEGGCFEHLSDWASKFPDAVARIAALLHITRHALVGPEHHEISDDDIQAAIRIGHALEAHALAAFDMMGADPALEGARAVLRWLERERCEAFTFRDCHYRHKSRFKRAADLEPALALLEERNYIRASNKKPVGPGRPSRIYEVTPLLLGVQPKP